MFSFLNSSFRKSIFIYLMLLFFINIFIPNIVDKNISQLAWLLIILAILSFLLNKIIFI